MSWPVYALQNVALVLNLTGAWATTRVWARDQDPHWIDHVSFVAVLIAAIVMVGLIYLSTNNTRPNAVPGIRLAQFAAAIASVILVVLGAGVVMSLEGTSRYTGLWWIATGVANVVLLWRLRARLSAATKSGLAE